MCLPWVKLSFMPVQKHMSLLPSVSSGTHLHSAYTISIHVHFGQSPPASQFPINFVCCGRWQRADDFGKGFGTSGQVYTGSLYSRYLVSLMVIVTSETTSSVGFTHPLLFSETR